MGAPLLFFPVDRMPLTMKAGLLKFPSDFGHGGDDTRYFLADDAASVTLAVKQDNDPAVRARRIGRAVSSAAEAQSEAAVLAWMRATLAREVPATLAAVDAECAAEDRPFWDALGRHLQEDFAILHRGEEGRGKTILLHVSGPSGWRPELLVGADFAGIHRPVPGFPGRVAGARDAASKSMVASMIERGPYVRFVWTVSADAHFDHHPESGLRAPWTSDAIWGKELYFRVERQMTVPFPNEDASLFLIRTFVYPLERLSAEQKEILADALLAMPPEIAAYKGLTHAIAPTVSRLREAR